MLLLLESYDQGRYSYSEHLIQTRRLVTRWTGK